jgi:calcium permeable stress-gated cation channel
LFSRTS